MHPTDYGEPVETLRVLVRTCVESLQPVTMGDIMHTLGPPEGYTRDFRDRVLLETKVDFYDKKGTPYRVLK